MSAIYRGSGVPSFLGIPPAFDFYDVAQIEAPAPELYEQWRLWECLYIEEIGLYYYKPTNELIEAESYEDAQLRADLSRGWDKVRAECRERGVELYKRHSSWWA